MNSFIGQEHIINHIKLLKEKDAVPRFIILTGNKSMGKTTLAIHLGEIIARKNVVLIDGKVDTVRSTIDSSYSAAEDTIYIVDDFEKMSINAKNALLQITEDCPRKAYFMLAGTNMAGLPKTLHNRACVFTMQPYSGDDLLFCAKSVGQFKENEINLLMEIVETPAEINYFKNIDLTDFYGFISTIGLKFGRLTGVESFRLTEKIKTKKEETGWDLRIVLKKINKIVLKAMEEKKIDCQLGFDIISAGLVSLGKLNTNSANVKYIFDDYLLNLREINR